jgi:hypothetical protein
MQRVAAVLLGAVVMFMGFFAPSYQRGKFGPIYPMKRSMRIALVVTGLVFILLGVLDLLS